MKRLFLGAPHDLLGAFQRVMPDLGWRAVTTAFLVGVVTWWIYVPIHELLHVAGCLATGGSVDRLEISPEYGAALLAKFFPFVAVGSDYPGQLTGFDTHGNDLIYLVTVFAPYLLTVIVGVPLLRRAASRGRDRVADHVLFGAAIPLAFAPFMNVLGDYYEMGSIAISRLVSLVRPGIDLDRWRSDDLVKLARTLSGDGGSLTDLLVLGAGSLLGILAAFATYRLGETMHDRLLRAGRDDGLPDRS